MVITVSILKGPIRKRVNIPKMANMVKMAKMVQMTNMTVSIRYETAKTNPKCLQAVTWSKNNTTQSIMNLSVGITTIQLILSIYDIPIVLGHNMGTPGRFYELKGLGTISWDIFTYVCSTAMLNSSPS